MPARAQLGEHRKWWVLLPWRERSFSLAALFTSWEGQSANLGLARFLPARNTAWQGKLGVRDPLFRFCDFSVENLPVMLPNACSTGSTKPPSARRCK